MHEGKRFFLTSLVGNLTQPFGNNFIDSVTGLSFKKDHVLVLNSRLIGKSVCQLSESELEKSVSDFIFTGCAIVGCGLPFTDTLSNFLEQALIDFMLHYDFEELTSYEFVAALQMNSKGWPGDSDGNVIPSVQFRGSYINVDFLGKVLKNYMRLRNQLDDSCIGWLKRNYQNENE